MKSAQACGRPAMFICKIVATMMPSRSTTRMNILRRSGRFGLAMPAARPTARVPLLCNSAGTLLKPDPGKRSSTRSRNCTIVCTMNSALRPRSMMGGQIFRELNLFCFRRRRAATAAAAWRRLRQERGEVAGCPGFDAGLLHESEIAKPIDETVLPFSKRRAIAIRQSATHAAAVTQGIARMTAIAVYVHFDVGNSGLQRGRQIFVGPNGVDAITRAGADNECRRTVVRNRRSRAAREGSRAGIREDDKIGSGRNYAQRIAAVFLVEVLEENRRGRRPFGPGRKSHDADFIGIDVPLFGVGAHQSNGLEGIVDRIGLHIATIPAQAIAQDDRVDAVVVKVGNKVGALRTDVECIMAAASGENDRRAGVDSSFHRVDLYRRVMNVDDPGD